MLKFVTTVALFASALCVFAQQSIHIRVVDSRNLRPVTDECLNITLGKWRGAVLFLPTDSAGQITLSIDGDKVTAPLAPAKACNTHSVTGPASFDSPLREISIVPDLYVSCQYSKELIKDPAWVNRSPAERIVSFSIDEVLRHGVAATNSCSKLRPEANPGELVITVRKRTFREWMES